MSFSESDEVSEFEETEDLEVVEQPCEESEDYTTTAPDKTLASKPGTKSKVWQYFGLEVGENGRVKDVNSPVCRIGSCHAHVKTKHSSTTNLYSHSNNTTQQSMNLLGQKKLNLHIQ